MLISMRKELERGWELLNEGKEEEALKLLRQIEKREGITQEESLRCEILKGFLLFFLGKFEEALILGEQAYQESMKFQKPLLSIDSLIVKWLPSMPLHRPEKPKEYIKDIEKTLRSTLQEPHSEVEQREALLYYIKGWFFVIEGELDNAIVSFKKSISICERYNRLSFVIPRVLSQLGGAYLIKGELKKSLKANKKGLELFKGSSIGNKLSKMWIFNSIGGIYYQQGDLDLAVEYYEKSVTIIEQVNLFSTYAFIYDNLIRIFLEKDDPKRVNEYLRLYQLQLKKSKNLESFSFFELSKARILKSSTRTRDRAKAEIILKELIEGQNISDFRIHDEFYPALILLCELYFEELKLTNDITILEDIQPLVERITKAAKQLNSYTLQAQTHLLHGNISLLQMNMGDARRYLTQAQQVAENHGLQLLARAISTEHDKLLEQLDKWEDLNKSNAPISERMALASLDESVELMQRKRAINKSELINENPILLLILGGGGILLFSYSFSDEVKVDDELFGGFLSAITSFSDEVFSEGLDRAKFGQYTVLMNNVGDFSFCYVLKGQTYLAKKKLHNFIENFQKNTSMMQTLNKFNKTSQVIEVKDFPFLEGFIKEIFTNK